MKRLPAVAVAAVVAGCGSGATPDPAPPPQALRLTSVLVTVVDGNTQARVRGALVKVGGRTARTNLHGVARIPLRRHVALVTQVRAGGYLSVVQCACRSTPVRSRPSPLPALAAVADVRRRREPHAVADRDSPAAAVPRDLGTRCRLADRVSCRRLGGDGVRRQLPRHRHRDRDERRPCALEAPPARREDGLVPRGLGRSPRRPRHGRRRPRPRAFERPPARALRRRLAGRVVAGRPRRDRLLRRLERPRLRARPAPHALALDVQRRAAS